MAYDKLELFPSNEFPSILKSLCGLMVAIHDDKLSLVHRTVREFFIAKSPPDSQIPTLPLSIKGSLSNAERAWIVCVKSVSTI